MELVEAKELDLDLDQVVVLMVEILCLTVIEQVVVEGVGPHKANTHQELLVQMVGLELPPELDPVVDQEEATALPVALEDLVVAPEVSTLVVEAVVPMLMEPPHQLTQMMVLLVVLEKHSLLILDLYLHQCPVHGEAQ